MSKNSGFDDGADFEYDDIADALAELDEMAGGPFKLSFDITDHFSHAAETVDRYVKLLKYLEKHEGIENPIILGGALRDAYDGMPVENLDIVTSTPLEGINSSHEALIRKVLDLSFDYEIKLMFKPKVETARQAMQEEGAPINAIAMGTDGKILADKHFVKHAKALAYVVPFNAEVGHVLEADERCERINERRIENGALPLTLHK